MGKMITSFSAFAAFLFAGANAPAADMTATPITEFQFDHVSCTGSKNEIRVRVTDVKENVGQIVGDLYRNDEEGFLKRAGRVQQVRFAAKAPTTFFCFRAPGPENYAIAIYHDENANKTFDKGAFGIPAEPFGISNNPKLRFRAPTVDEALFEVASDGANVEINMRN